jgi:putative redox protein
MARSRYPQIPQLGVTLANAAFASKVERAVKLSADKYCSAAPMMAKTAVAVHDFEVIDSRI